MINSGAYKFCPSCKKEKGTHLFSVSIRKKDGLQTYCKECHLAKVNAGRSSPEAQERIRAYQREYHRRVNYAPQREWEKRNPEKKKEYARRYHERWGRNKWLKEAYGLTEQIVDGIRNYQNNRCAICKEELVETYRQRYHVDHNHATGQVRGLLCFTCNVGIGKFGDNPEVLQNAIEYLRNPPAVQYFEETRY